MSLLPFLDKETEDKIGDLCPRTQSYQLVGRDSPYFYFLAHLQPCFSPGLPTQHTGTAQLPVPVGTHGLGKVGPVGFCSGSTWLGCFSCDRGGMVRTQAWVLKVIRRLELPGLWVGLLATPFLSFKDWWPLLSLPRLNGLCHQTVRKHMGLWQQISKPEKGAKGIFDHRWLLSSLKFWGPVLPAHQETVRLFFMCTIPVQDSAIALQRQHTGHVPQWACEAVELFFPCCLFLARVSPGEGVAFETRQIQSCDSL